MSFKEVKKRYDLVGWIDGQRILWKDRHEIIHMADGSLLTPEDFCLWTYCGAQDIPANTAYKGSMKEVTCSDCNIYYQCLEIERKNNNG